MKTLLAVAAYLFSKLNLAKAYLREAYLKNSLASLGRFAGNNPYYALCLKVVAPQNVSIGEQCSFGGDVILVGHGTITIGNYCMFAHGAKILTATHDYTVIPFNTRTICRNVTIGNNVWVGANAIIMPGITVGNNVVIGAGAVVTKDVPDGNIVAGVPARTIRHLPAECDLEKSSTIPQITLP